LLMPLEQMPPRSYHLKWVKEWNKFGMKILTSFRVSMQPYICPMKATNSNVSLRHV
jgi:hypothetical protein